MGYRKNRGQDEAYDIVDDHKELGQRFSWYTSGKLDRKVYWLFLSIMFIFFCIVMGLR